MGIKITTIPAGLSLDQTLAGITAALGAGLAPRVMGYDTSAALDGTASAELVEASEDESSGTGAVPAYRDSDGVWQFVPPSQVEHFTRNLNETVITVYVEA